MANLKSHLMCVTKETTTWCSLGWAVLYFVCQAVINRAQEQPVEPATFQQPRCLTNKPHLLHENNEG